MEAWPKEWHHLPYDDPVCPLVLALYGHPDSEGYWEQHCVVLSVYVDDSKMAGPAEQMELLWKQIAEKINIEFPRVDRSIGRYLGCDHILYNIDVQWGENTQVVRGWNAIWNSSCIHQWPCIRKLLAQL